MAAIGTLPVTVGVVGVVGCSRCHRRGAVLASC